MQSKYIRALRAAFPHTVPVLTGFLFVGIAYGIYMNSCGYSYLWTALVSLTVYAGSAQFVLANLLVGGKVLPGAVFGLLVIYCFKSVVPSVSPFGIPELVASAVVVAVHLWRRSMLVSVLSGTAVYMVTVQGIVPMFSMLF